MIKVKIFLASVILASLAGCAGGPRGSYGTGASWGNYKCTAKKGENGKSYKGWSTHKSAARASALSKCEAAGGGGCHITQCVNAS